MGRYITDAPLEMGDLLLKSCLPCLWSMPSVLPSQDNAPCWLLVLEQDGADELMLPLGVLTAGPPSAAQCQIGELIVLLNCIVESHNNLYLIASCLSLMLNFTMFIDQNSGKRNDLNFLRF